MFRAIAKILLKSYKIQKFYFPLAYQKLADSP